MQVRDFHRGKFMAVLHVPRGHQARCAVPWSPKRGRREKQDYWEVRIVLYVGFPLCPPFNVHCSPRLTASMSGISCVRHYGWMAMQICSAFPVVVTVFSVPCTPRDVLDVVGQKRAVLMRWLTCRDSLHVYPPVHAAYVNTHLRWENFPWVQGSTGKGRQDGLEIRGEGGIGRR